MFCFPSGLRNGHDVTQYITAEDASRASSLLEKSITVPSHPRFASSFSSIRLYLSNYLYICWFFCLRNSWNCSTGSLPPLVVNRGPVLVALSCESFFLAFENWFLMRKGKRIWFCPVNWVAWWEIELGLVMCSGSLTAGSGSIWSWFDGGQLRSDRASPLARISFLRRYHVQSCK